MRTSRLECARVLARRVRAPHIAVLASAGLLAGVAGTGAAAAHGHSAPGPRPVAVASAPAPDVTSHGPGGVLEIDNRPFFAISLQDPPPLHSLDPTGKDGLSRVAGAGVNLFLVHPRGPEWHWKDIATARAWDAAAARRGVHTYIALRNMARATPHSHRDGQLHRVVKALLRDPNAGSIAMWYGADEPWWLNSISAKRLRYPYCVTTGRGQRSWCQGEKPIDRRRLWLVVEAPRGTAKDIAPYSRVTDVHGVDIYPVDINDKLAGISPDLHQVGRWTKTVASITPDHSVWTTLQICFSGSYSGDHYVLPTRAQERYMMYDAIINGARALGFYGGNNPACWSATDKKHGWNWSFWHQTLEPLVQGISAQSPLGPVLADPAATRSVATGDSRAEAITREVRVGDKRQLWIMAAQNSNTPGKIVIKHLPKDVSLATVYREGRKVAVREGVLTDTIGRWGVHVYEMDLPQRQTPAGHRALG